ncbi:MAG TPA: hypothetical protein PKE39_15070 [Ignavibacteria bacterium]|nr:hypothetical protein [Ignavibacteria bacterium]HMR00342.1 hypothetical protein [Ignavibacteria bacterium]
MQTKLYNTEKNKDAKQYAAIMVRREKVSGFLETTNTIREYTVKINIRIFDFITEKLNF